MNEYIKRDDSQLEKHKKAHKRDINRKNKKIRIALNTRLVYNIIKNTDGS